MNAELHATPLWTVNATQNVSDISCLLVQNNVDGQTSIMNFNGDSRITCDVNLKTSTGTGILLQIPQPMPRNTFLHAEHDAEDLGYCQSRFSVIAADEPCFIVFRQTMLQLFLMPVSFSAT